MKQTLTRRNLMTLSAAAAAASVPMKRSVAAAPTSSPTTADQPRRRMKLGLVTYNIAADWDLASLIERCEKLGLAAVELRTTHKHGVEPNLNPTQRAEVKQRFIDSGVVLWGLGTTCEFHSPEKSVLQENIESARGFIDLAHAVGARGIKVRPNSLPDEVSKEQTIRQIADALRTCGDAGAAADIEIWLEVHGRGTSHPPILRRIMDLADHPNVGVTWNSNHPGDLKDGSVRPYFELLSDRIRSVHINELTNGYPYRELFLLLNGAGYDRYTLIEASGLKSSAPEDTIRFVQYYKALWDMLSTPPET